jgi:acyl-CoA synthetase (NDP forming)
MTFKPSPKHFKALFEPRGVAVAGVSAHPGKFGFAAFHNIAACGYPGNLWGTTRSGDEVLGRATYPSIADLPDGDLDLVFLCVPPTAISEVLREAAARGARAAFCATAGFGEAGPDGVALQEEISQLAAELGILFAGPNGQGLLSTPASLCAQIVAPMPPRGSIGIASQSGGFVSAFANLATAGGVGISRAISAGNAAQVGVADYLEYYADDPETNVGLVYLEHVGADLVGRLSEVSERLPVVLLRGGRSDSGPLAVAAHTGSTAGGAAVDAELTEAGVCVVDTVGEAVRTAATFASQPLPKGPRTVVFGTAGGWGVVTADAVQALGLDLIDLPDDVKTAIDGRVPPRWSRRNPIDLAGGESRDTIPELLPLITAHPDVDAVIYLGLGIQSNQAKLLRSSDFYPDHGIERIVEYHERQDRRFAEAAAEASDATGKPVLTATELALADPDNPGPAGVRSSGRFCHAGGDEAAAALARLWEYADWRSRRAPRQRK